MKLWPKGGQASKTWLPVDNTAKVLPEAHASDIWDVEQKQEQAVAMGRMLLVSQVTQELPVSFCLLKFFKAA